MIRGNLTSAPAVRQEYCHGGAGAVLFRRILEKEFSSKISFLDHTVIPSGASIGYHRHDDSEEVYVILRGRALMTVDGETAEVGPGDVVLNVRGGSHGLVNHSDEDVAILVFEGRF
jgi:quercetin dioxygenase-like cupin family protein